MKKKLFLGAGAILLTSLGVFAGRTSAMFGTKVPALFYSSGGVCTQIQSLNAVGAFQTVTGTGTAQASILTASGVNKRLIFSTLTCSSLSKVYFRG